MADVDEPTDPCSPSGVAVTLVPSGHDGLDEGLSPLRLGDTAAISFVRLPDGDWVELSQRASLTGPLPEAADLRR